MISKHCDIFFFYPTQILIFNDLEENDAVWKHCGKGEMQPTFSSILNKSENTTHIF